MSGISWVECGAMLSGLTVEQFVEALQSVGTNVPLDDAGRPAGCSCGLVGPATTPMIVDLDLRCPPHGQ